MDNYVSVVSEARRTERNTFMIEHERQNSKQRDLFSKWRVDAI